MKHFFPCLARLLKRALHHVLSSSADWIFLVLHRDSFVKNADFIDIKEQVTGFPGGTYNPGAVTWKHMILALVRAEMYRPLQLYFNAKKAIRSCKPFLLRASSDFSDNDAYVPLVMQDFPDQRLRRYEDFRLFTYEGKILSNLCVFIPNLNTPWPTVIDPANQNRQALAELDVDGRTLRYLGGVQLDMAMQNREKNFMYFEHEKDLYLLYSISPYLLLKANNWPHLSFSTVLHKEIELPFHEKHHRKIHLSANPVIFDDSHLITIISRKANGYGLVKTRFVTWAILIDRVSLEPVKISSRCITALSDVYISSIVMNGESMLLLGGRDDRTCCHASFAKKDIEFIDL